MPAAVLTSLQYLGKLRVLVSFDYSPKEPQIGASVQIVNVCINGEEIDPELFSADLIAEWEELIAIERSEEDGPDPDDERDRTADIEDYERRVA